ncbi:hypothetical protein PIB30_022599 [Stylosanthes scabra]|uniref:Uncharacterized protein n=1 Tax=Stylosanthes scabra TaxID=79078 RepID=A0ABU6R9H6_9FABA|nr:hypothetical protein [Stylosanthes scabra]
MPLITAAIGSACWRTFNERKTRSPATVKSLPMLCYAPSSPGIRCGTVTTTPATIYTLGITGRTLLSPESAVV